MDIVLLVKSVVGLAIILGFLILILVLPQRREKKREEERKKEEENREKKEFDDTSFEKLYAIIKHRASTTGELQSALELLIKYHPTIHKKLGIRAHPESDVYMDIIFKLCRHKNTNKNITIAFISQLEKSNPEYKKEINDAMMRGLNSRGI